MNVNIEKRLQQLVEEGKQDLRAELAQKRNRIKEAYGDLTVTVNAAELMFFLQTIDLAYVNRAEVSGGSGSVTNFLETRTREQLLAYARFDQQNLQDKVFEAYRAARGEKVPGA